MDADVKFTDERGKWKCIQCGACCRAKVAIQLLLPGFWDESKQSCKNLTEDNRCAIYENRPEVCRTRRAPGDDARLARACAQLYQQFPKEVS